MKDIIKSSSTRIKTGIALLIAILIIGFIDSFFIMWLLFGGLLVISINESQKLYDMKVDSIYFYVGIIWFIAYFYPYAEDLVFVAAIVFASILAYSKNLDKKIFLPLMYPTASFLFLLTLYYEYGVMSLLWLLVIVAGADVGAYFVGKSIGKTKFCETSPNKTVEGVLGGLVVATILGIIFAIDNISLLGAIIISLVVALASVFGDLFESYLKREAGVKDSGDILPGHGGILDRTDGYLFGGVMMLVILRAVL
ncbi:phosphatidate cytidylyltransferase [Halarcobacter anaerophilus]|uniref:Phosphatidate cytidylyltransferase n=1 Tax=Halarcobacter anaerophilus TaxID=877500 RepID=A0A4V1LQB9_9BACT|nr:phosphatidate cytidylyltransferase [Halarcobacter anaerophilus]QDF27816.1 CDP-diglyceride synthetase [Halarcobacter anaerophilus]RXJ64158.1 phosphatidate cytidylyltransferase [Halarcobacter anaerophilus]